jgi:hypothetical protein
MVDCSAQLLILGGVQDLRIFGISIKLEIGEFVIINKSTIYCSSRPLVSGSNPTAKIMTA